MTAGSRNTPRRLEIAETPWLLIAAAVMIPVGLAGWAVDAPWVHVRISSPPARALVFGVFVGLELLLLVRGVWPRKIVVDPDQGALIVRRFCPLVYPAVRIPIAEIQEVAVESHYSFHSNRSLYQLAIRTQDGTSIHFGDWNDSDAEKHEGWRDQILAHAGLAEC